MMILTVKTLVPAFANHIMFLANRQDYNQSVAPDGPSMPPPIKKETWVAGKQEGGAGR